MQRGEIEFAIPTELKGRMGSFRKKGRLEMKILILVAIEDELKRTDLPNLQIEYIGVGKVNAAFNTH